MEEKNQEIVQNRLTNAEDPNMIKILSEKNFKPKDKASFQIEVRTR